MDQFDRDMKETEIAWLMSHIAKLEKQLAEKDDLYQRAKLYFYKERKRNDEMQAQLESKS